MESLPDSDLSWSINAPPLTHGCHRRHWVHATADLTLSSKQRVIPLTLVTFNNRYTVS